MYTAATMRTVRALLCALVVLGAIAPAFCAPGQKSVKGAAGAVKGARGGNVKLRQDPVDTGAIDTGATGSIEPITFPIDAGVGDTGATGATGGIEPITSPIETGGSGGVGGILEPLPIQSPTGTDPADVGITPVTDAINCRKEHQTCSTNPCCKGLDCIRKPGDSDAKCCDCGDVWEECHADSDCCQQNGQELLCVAGRKKGYDSYAGYGRRDYSDHADDYPDSYDDNRKYCKLRDEKPCFVNDECASGVCNGVSKPTTGAYNTPGQCCAKTKKPVLKNCSIGGDCCSGQCQPYKIKQSSGPPPTYRLSPSNQKKCCSGENVVCFRDIECCGEDGRCNGGYCTGTS